CRASLTELRDKILDRQIRLPKNRARRSPIELFVIRYDNLCERFVAPQNDVARALPHDAKPSVSAPTQSRPDTRGSLVTPRPRSSRSAPRESASVLLRAPPRTREWRRVHWRSPLPASV